MYVYEDNSVYTNAAGAAAGDFSGFIADARFGNQPRQIGRFILIAPGGDRKYFTPDDIKNW
jgi:hypothetical protein